ncbi:hypothetical protein [Thermocrispum municipale]|uniref:WXG100-like domain-containing protein n=1 Tax=Thermocrispum municipale TaxID=37926 RepID=UPI00040396DF|nr:hypothetical protein [Thermocrispum municipale]
MADGGGPPAEAAQPPEVGKAPPGGGERVGAEHVSTGDFEGLFGDLGPPGGPLWEYILNWINPWPQDSHSDANALGDAWMDAANAVEALIQQAGAAASAIATAWPDAAGQMYVQRTRTFIESLWGVHAAMVQLANLAYDYARELFETKAQIVIEVLANTAGFVGLGGAGTFLGRFFGKLVAKHLASFIANKIAQFGARAAAAMLRRPPGRLAPLGGDLVTNALKHGVKEGIKEGAQEAAVDTGGQLAAMTFGADKAGRGFKTDQVAQSGFAGTVSVVPSNATRAAVNKVVPNKTAANVIGSTTGNAVASPTSSHFVASVTEETPEGQEPKQWWNLKQYGEAILKDGGRSGSIGAIHGTIHEVANRVLPPDGPPPPNSTAVDGANLGNGATNAPPASSPWESYQHGLDGATAPDTAGSAGTAPTGDQAAVGQPNANTSGDQATGAAPSVTTPGDQATGAAPAAAETSVDSTTGAASQGGTDATSSQPPAGTSQEASTSQGPAAQQAASGPGQTDAQPSAPDSGATQNHDNSSGVPPRGAGAGTAGLGSGGGSGVGSGAAPTSATTHGTDTHHDGSPDDTAVEQQQDEAAGDVTSGQADAGQNDTTDSAVDTTVVDQAAQNDQAADSQPGSDQTGQDQTSDNRTEQDAATATDDASQGTTEQNGPTDGQVAENQSATQDTNLDGRPTDSQDSAGQSTPGDSNTQDGTTPTAEDGASGPVVIAPVDTGGPSHTTSANDARTQRANEQNRVADKAPDRVAEDDQTAPEAKSEKTEHDAEQAERDAGTEQAGAEQTGRDTNTDQAKPEDTSRVESHAAEPNPEHAKAEDTDPAAAARKKLAPIKELIEQEVRNGAKRGEIPQLALEDVPGRIGSWRDANSGKYFDAIPVTPDDFFSIQRRIELADLVRKTLGQQHLPFVPLVVTGLGADAVNQLRAQFGRLSDRVLVIDASGKLSPADLTTPPSKKPELPPDGPAQLIEDEINRRIGPDGVKLIGSGRSMSALVVPRPGQTPEDVVNQVDELVNGPREKAAGGKRRQRPLSVTINVGQFTPQQIDQLNNLIAARKSLRWVRINFDSYNNIAQIARRFLTETPEPASDKAPDSPPGTSEQDTTDTPGRDSAPEATESGQDTEPGTSETTDDNASPPADQSETTTPSPDDVPQSDLDKALDPPTNNERVVAAAIHSGHPRGRMPYVEELLDLVPEAERGDANTTTVEQELLNDWNRLLAPPGPGEKITDVDGAIITIGNRKFHVKLALTEPKQAYLGSTPTEGILNTLQPGGGPEVAESHKHGTYHAAGVVVAGGKRSTSHEASLEASTRSEASVAAVINRGDARDYHVKAEMIVTPIDETGRRDTANTVTFSGKTTWVSVGDAAWNVPPKNEQYSKQVEKNTPPPDFMAANALAHIDKIVDRVMKAIAKKAPEYADDPVVRDHVRIRLADLQTRFPDALRSRLTLPIQVHGKHIATVKVRTALAPENAEMTGGWKKDLFLEQVRVAFTFAGTNAARTVTWEGSASAKLDLLDMLGIELPEGVIPPWVHNVAEALRVFELSGAVNRSWAHNAAASILGIRVFVDRWAGPSYQYQIPATHTVEVEFDDRTTSDKITVDDTVLARMRAPEAYEYGLPVGKEAFDGDPKNGKLRGVPTKKADKPTPNLPLDAHGRPRIGVGIARGMRQTDAPAPENDHHVAAMRDRLFKELKERGYLPKGGRRVSKRTAEVQQRNLAVLTQQLDPEGLETRYDQLSQDGIRLWLQKPAVFGRNKFVEIHLRLDEVTNSEYLGSTTDRVQVHLDIGQSTSTDGVSGSVDGNVGRKIWWYRRGKSGSISARNDTSQRSNLVSLLEQQAGSPSHAWRVKQKMFVELREGKHTARITDENGTDHFGVSTELLMPDAFVQPEQDFVASEGTTSSDVLTSAGAAIVDASVKGLHDAATKVTGEAVESADPIFRMARSDDGFDGPVGRAALASLTDSTTIRDYFKPMVEGRTGIEYGLPDKVGFRQSVEVKVATDEHGNVLGDTTYLGKEKKAVHGRISLNMFGWLTSLVTGRGGNRSIAPGEADIDPADMSVGGSATRGTSVNRGRDYSRMTGTEDINVSNEQRFIFRTRPSLIVTSTADPSAVQQQASETVPGEITWTLAESDALRFYAGRKLNLPPEAVLEALQRARDGDNRTPPDVAERAAQRLRDDLAGKDDNAEHLQKLDRLGSFLPVDKTRSLPEFLSSLWGIGALAAVEEVRFAKGSPAEEVIQRVHKVLGDDHRASMLGKALAQEFTPSRMRKLVREGTGVDHRVMAQPINNREQLEVFVRFEPVGEPRITGYDRNGFIQDQSYSFRTTKEATTHGRAFEAGANLSPENEQESPSGETGRNNPGSSSSGITTEHININISHHSGTYQVESPMQMVVDVRRTPIKSEPTEATEAKQDPPLHFAGTIELNVAADLATDPADAMSETLTELPVGEVRELPNRAAGNHVPVEALQNALREVLLQGLTDTESDFGPGERGSGFVDRDYSAADRITRQLLTAESTKVNLPAMASRDGHTATIDLPNHPGDTVTVTTKLSFSNVQVTRLTDDGGLGSINRKQESLSHTTGRDVEWSPKAENPFGVIRQMLARIGIPQHGATFGSGADGKTSAGYRIEHAGKEKGPRVLVQAQVTADFDITLNNGPINAERQLLQFEGQHGRYRFPELGQATFIVYEADLPALQQQLESLADLAQARAELYLTEDGGSLAGDHSIPTTPSSPSFDLDGYTLADPVTQAEMQQSLARSATPPVAVSDPNAGLIAEMTERAAVVQEAMNRVRAANPNIDAFGDSHASRALRAANEVVESARALQEMRDANGDRSLSRTFDEAHAAQRKAAMRAAEAQKTAMVQAANDMIDAANRAVEQHNAQHPGDLTKFDSEWQNLARSPRAEARQLAIRSGRPVVLHETGVDGSLDVIRANPDGTFTRPFMEYISADLMTELRTRGVDPTAAYFVAHRTGMSLADAVQRLYDDVSALAARYGLPVQDVMAQAERAAEEVLAEQLAAAMENRAPDPELVRVPPTLQDRLSELLESAIPAKDRAAEAVRQAMTDAGFGTGSPSELTYRVLVHELNRGPNDLGISDIFTLAMDESGTPEDLVSALRELREQAFAVDAPAPSPEVLASLFGFDAQTESQQFTDRLRRAGLLDSAGAPRTEAIVNLAGQLAFRYGLTPAQRRVALETGPSWFAGQADSMLPGSSPLDDIVSSESDRAPQAVTSDEFRRILQRIINRYYHGLAPGEVHGAGKPPAPADIATVAEALINGGAPNAARAAAALPGARYRGALDDNFLLVTGDPNTPSPEQYRALGEQGSRVSWVAPGPRSIFAAAQAVTGEDHLQSLSSQLTAELSENNAPENTPLWNSLPEFHSHDARTRAIKSLESDQIDRRLARQLPRLIAATSGVRVTVVAPDGAVEDHGPADAEHTVTLLRTGPVNNPHYMPVLSSPRVTVPSDAFVTKPAPQETTPDHKEESVVGKFTAPSPMDDRSTVVIDRAAPGDAAQPEQEPEVTQADQARDGAQQDRATEDTQPTRQDDTRRDEGQEDGPSGEESDSIQPDRDSVDSRPDQAPNDTQPGQKPDTTRPGQESDSAQAAGPEAEPETSPSETAEQVDTAPAEDAQSQTRDDAADRPVPAPRPGQFIAPSPMDENPTVLISREPHPDEPQAHRPGRQEGADHANPHADAGPDPDAQRRRDDKVGTQPHADDAADTRTDDASEPAEDSRPDARQPNPDTESRPDARQPDTAPDTRADHADPTTDPRADHTADPTTAPRADDDSDPAVDPRPDGSQPDRPDTSRTSRPDTPTGRRRGRRVDFLRPRRRPWPFPIYFDPPEEEEEPPAEPTELPDLELPVPPKDSDERPETRPERPQSRRPHVPRPEPKADCPPADDSEDRPTDSDSSEDDRTPEQPGPPEDDERPEQPCPPEDDQPEQPCPPEEAPEEPRPPEGTPGEDNPPDQQPPADETPAPDLPDLDDILEKLKRLLHQLLRILDPQLLGRIAELMAANGVGVEVGLGDGRTELFEPPAQLGTPSGPPANGSPNGNAPHGNLPDDLLMAAALLMMLGAMGAQLLMTALNSGTDVRAAWAESARTGRRPHRVLEDHVKRTPTQATPGTSVHVLRAYKSVDRQRVPVDTESLVKLLKQAGLTTIADEVPPNRWTMKIRDMFTGNEESVRA